MSIYGSTVVKPRPPCPHLLLTCAGKFYGGSHALLSSQSDPTHQHGQTRLRRLREDRRYLGPFASLPGVRTRGLLRFLEEQARDQTLSPQQTPSDSIDRAGRILGLVLCGLDDARRVERREAGGRLELKPALRSRGVGRFVSGQVRFGGVLYSCVSQGASGMSPREAVGAAHPQLSEAREFFFLLYFPTGISYIAH